jgi:hypothetical protein
MSGWTSKQFASSIPIYCRKGQTFPTFVRAVLSSLSPTVSVLVATASKARISFASDFATNVSAMALEDTRETARICIKSLISDPLPTDDRKGTDFISRQVVLDLEEVWDLLFGPPLVVNPGYGGNQGFSVLSPASQSDDVSPTAWSKAILHEIENSWTPSELRIMGLYKAEGKNGVFVKLNGRRFTMEDAEHPACGALYHPIALTLPNRSCCVPAPASAHCHPIPLYADSSFFGALGCQLFSIANDAIAAWHNYVPQIVSLPKVFLLRDEVEIMASLDSCPNLQLDGASYCVKAPPPLEDIYVDGVVGAYEDDPFHEIALFPSVDDSTSECFGGDLSLDFDPVCELDVNQDLTIARASQFTDDNSEWEPPSSLDDDSDSDYRSHRSLIDRGKKSVRIKKKRKRR